MLDGWCGVRSPPPPQYIYGSCVEYNKQCEQQSIQSLWKQMWKWSVASEGRAAAAPPRGRQILHFLSDQTAPRPAPPWPAPARPGGIQSDYFPIFGSIGKPDFLPPFIQQSLAGLIMFVDTGKFFCYAIISRIGMWWERGFKLAFKPGHFKTFNAPLGVSMDIDKLCKNCCKHWAHIL